MELHFKYGFEENGFVFGWKDKELYRLYSERHNRVYPLKKLNRIIVGNKPGYCVDRKKVSLDKLREKTVLINQKVYIVQDKDCPF